MVTDTTSLCPSDDSGTASDAAKPWPPLVQRYVPSAARVPCRASQLIIANVCESNAIATAARTKHGDSVTRQEKRVFLLGKTGDFQGKNRLFEAAKIEKKWKILRILKMLIFDRAAFRPRGCHSRNQDVLAFITVCAWA